MSSQTDAPDGARLNLYSYVTAEYADQYIKIMRLLGGEILAQELNAAELCEGLRDSGFDVTVDDVEERCRALSGWGNIIVTVRNTRVATIAELRHRKNRYQASNLGARVARNVDEVLAATDGAREVARELLAGIVENLDKVVAQVGGGRVDADALAAAVTTIFTTHNSFAESLRNFYSYLGGVLTRYDLVGEEYLTMKTILINYIDLISADVQRHAPQIADRLEKLTSIVGSIIGTLDTWQTLTEDTTERSPGRTAADWEQLTRWYSGSNETSGPVALRAATDQALKQLLVNAIRIVSNAGNGMSRRDDLLRLATQFSESDDSVAHQLFADTFGAYSWRHLSLGDAEGLQPPAGTSWWAAPPVDVPVTLRERGDRTARGRTSTVVDATMEAELQYREALERQRLERVAVTELIAAGSLDDVKLTPASQDLFLTQLTRMAAQTDLEAISENTDCGFRLHRQPIEGVTTVTFDDGALTIHGFRYTVTALREYVEVEATG